MLYALISILVITMVSPATDPIEGTWIADLQKHQWRDVSESMWLTLRASEREGRHGYNVNLALKDIEGLGITSSHEGRTDVKFEVNREAGRLTFEGRFVNDVGSGTFTFESHESYVSKMGRLGYNNLSTGKLLTLTIHDVTTQFVEDLQELGYNNVL